jgi:hypothetical protein
MICAHARDAAEKRESHGAHIGRHELAALAADQRAHFAVEPCSTFELEKAERQIQRKGNGAHFGKAFPVLDNEAHGFAAGASENFLGHVEEVS